MLKRLWIYCRRVLVAFSLLYLTITFTPLTFYWTNALASPWNGPEGDVLVVLSGSGLVDALGDSSYFRAVYAVRAMRSTPYEKVIVCGAQNAPMMRDFIAGHGLKTDQVVVENESRNTYENVRNALPLIPPGKRVVLLTSDYHIYRSVHLFHKAGLDVRTFPAPDALKRYTNPDKRWSVFLDLCLESAKIIFYTWKGWI